jgi:hypothetical protein
MIPADAMQPETREVSGSAQCIEITGADARAFAQAQFAGDVRALQAGHWQWNAWLDAKGGVRALMHLADLGGGRLIALLRGGDAQSRCAELRHYVLRSKVSIEAPGGWLCRPGGELPLGTIRAEADAITFGFGDRSLWLGRSSASDGGNQDALRLADMRDGWPTLPPRAMRILRIARKPGIKDHPAEKISAKARGRTAGMQDFPGCRSA